MSLIVERSFDLSTLLYQFSSCVHETIHKMEYREKIVVCVFEVVTHQS